LGSPEKRLFEQIKSAQILLQSKFEEVIPVTQISFSILRQILEQGFNEFMSIVPTDDDQKLALTQDTSALSDSGVYVLEAVLHAYVNLRSHGYSAEEATMHLREDVVQQVLAGKEEWAQRLLD